MSALKLYKIGPWITFYTLLWHRHYLFSACKIIKCQFCVKHKYKLLEIVLSGTKSLNPNFLGKKSKNAKKSSIWHDNKTHQNKGTNLGIVLYVQNNFTYTSNCSKESERNSVWVWERVLYGGLFLDTDFCANILHKWLIVTVVAYTGCQKTGAIPIKIQSCFNGLVSTIIIKFFT